MDPVESAPFCFCSAAFAASSANCAEVIGAKAASVSDAVDVSDVFVVSSSAMSKSH